MDFSASAILKRIKNGFKNPVNKIEGGFSMDNAQTVSEEIARLHAMEISLIPDRTLLDTAEGEYLDRKALEYYETRSPAQGSVGEVTFTGGSAGQTVPKGIELSASVLSLGFVTTATSIFDEDGSCTVSAVCAVAGTVGNIGAGQLDTIINAGEIGIDGVAVTNAEPFTGGADVESDDAFRARILEKIQKPITGGNENTYVYWAKQVPGVSDALCKGCWAGPLSVLVIVLSDSFDVPDDTIIQNVRVHIEENRTVGADVTVRAAASLPVSVEAVIVRDDTYDIDDIRAEITAAMSEYLAGIAFKKGAPLSYYKIGDIIFNTPGVDDIIDYTLNGGNASLTAGFGEFFRLLEVDIRGNK